MPSRAARLLQLLERLRAHRQPVPGAALAAELGISLRTLYRDVSTLREQGARIDGDPGVGYLLRPGFTLPPLMFSEDELEALILGARWVANHAADPELAQAAHGVMNRIGNVLPPALRLAVETSGLFVPPPHDCYRPAPAPWLPTLRRAIRDEHVLQLDYRDEAGHVTQRRIWPFAMAFFDQARLIAAWCEPALWMTFLCPSLWLTSCWSDWVNDDFLHRRFMKGEALFKCGDCSQIGPAKKKLHGAWYLLLPVWFVGAIFAVALPYVGIPALMILYFLMRKNHCTSCGSMNVERYFTEEERQKMNEAKEEMARKKQEDAVMREIKQSQKASENQKIINLKMDLNLLPDGAKKLRVKVVGGAGWEPMHDTSIDVKIASDALVFYDFKRIKKISLPYGEIRSIDIGGPGKVTSGGGFAGGGFGEGALVGMGIATLANILTTHSSTKTYVRLLLEDAELILLSSDTEPDKMRILLSPLFVKSTKMLEHKPEIDSNSMTRQLVELKGLHESGALSDEQYKKAVDKIVS